uniref:cation:proton antiporter domain-containing protein n=1 Tax=Candidatus Enterococcus willemsii TaxID=1857215 RepID=UPI00403F2CB6
MLCGLLLSTLFEKSPFSTVTQVLIMLSVSFSFVSVENYFTNLPFSGILAVMAMAIMIYRQTPTNAQNISRIYDQLWVPGEIFLFILVGASVNITFAFSAGWMPIIVVISALAIRMIGVWLSLLGTNLNVKEKVFCAIGYSPKATVQAAIGAVPLALGLPAGELILTELF